MEFYGMIKRNVAPTPPQVRDKGQNMNYVHLTEEDRELLINLHSFIYLHRDFIREHIYSHLGSMNTFYRRLRQMEDAGYIKAFNAPASSSDRKPSKIFTLTKFGVDMVYELKGITHWNNRWTRQLAPFYQHQLLIAEVVKAFENKAEEAGLEFKEWVTEARAFYEYTDKGEKKVRKLRPDGIIVIGKKGSEQCLGLMIEMERSYSTREKNLRKMEQYNEFFVRKNELLTKYDRKVGFEYPVQHFKVLFIGADESKTKKTLRDLRGEEKGAEISVMVTSFDEVLEAPYGSIYRYLSDPENKKKM